MNKRQVKGIIKIGLYAISGILLLCFCVFSIVDCVRYDEMLTSAPLELVLFVRAIEFLLPALLAFGGALLLRKFNKK